MLVWLDVPLEHVADMVLLGMRRYSSKQLLSVVGSAAKLGFDNDMLMDTITSRLLKEVETLDAAQLVDLVSKQHCCCLLKDSSKHAIISVLMIQGFDGCRSRH